MHKTKEFVLFGITDAAARFNKCAGPANIYLDAFSGEVWTASGRWGRGDYSVCIISKPFYSDKTISEEELYDACSRCLSALVSCP